MTEWQTGQKQYAPRFRSRRHKNQLSLFLRIKCSLFEKPGVPFTQSCFVPSLVEIGLVVVEKKIFNHAFSLFCYYLPLERAWPFILRNLNPYPTRMLWGKSDWNWPSGSGEDEDDRRSEKLNWAFSSGELIRGPWPTMVTWETSSNQ